MAPVIELCRRCGFDIPVDARVCPGCGPVDRRPIPRAAQQVAGGALLTRSARPLPTTRARRDPQPPAIGPADGARSAFGYATLFLLLTLGAALLGWASGLDRFVLDVPEGTPERLHDVAIVTTWGSIVGVVIGVLAMVSWTIRRVRVGIARRRLARVRL